MKFVVSSSDLSSHLQAISKVLNSKNTMQILNEFLFDLQGDRLTMTASDSETTLTTSMEVNSAEGEGKIAVTARLLLDTLKEFPDIPLTFIINDKNLGLEIKTENGEYKFIGQSGDLYPSMPEMEENTQEVRLNSGVLLEGINKTLFCVADDSLRPIMNGILFDIQKEGKITFVATDAHKLVKYVNKTNSNSENLNENSNFVLPKKPATTLRNTLDKEPGEVVIRFDSKKIFFQFGDYSMICLQIEGKYPNYDAVIPQNNPYKIIADRQSAHDVIKRVSVYSNQASNLVKMDFENNIATVSAQDIDFSISAYDNFPVQFEGEPIKIGFRSDFLVEMLSTIKDEEIMFVLADPSTAGILLPTTQNEDEELLMLLMPMLLNE